MSPFEPIDDPYVDPVSGVLVNLLGVETREALRLAEADLVWARTNQLLESPPPTTGDLAQLRAIHRHLFQDVFEWAGQLRAVDLTRDTPGSQPFLLVSFIERAAESAAAALREEALLRGLERREFVERLAFHYDAFNYIHPFREGNGRTQRLMWSQIAREAGWVLDWRSVQGERNDEACRVAAVDLDLTRLEAMFDDIVSERAPRA